jgi:hypothetical protein
MSDDMHLEWVCLTHPHKPKALEWYRYVLYAGGILLLISLFLQNFLFSFFIIIATAVLFIVGSETPKEERYALTTQGVRAGKTLYPHHILYSYSLNKDEHFPLLILQSDKTFSPHILIPLGDTDWGLVREYFKAHKVREVHHETNLIDKAIEFIGF